MFLFNCRYTQHLSEQQALELQAQLEGLVGCYALLLQLVWCMDAIKLLQSFSLKL